MKKMQERRKWKIWNAVEFPVTIGYKESAKTFDNVRQLLKHLRKTQPNYIWASEKCHYFGYFWTIKHTWEGASQ